MYWVHAIMIAQVPSVHKSKRKASITRLYETGPQPGTTSGTQN